MPVSAVVDNQFVDVAVERRPAAEQPAQIHVAR